MPANAFELFMSSHPPVGELVDRANAAMWDQSALNPIVKERVRIALAEAIGCSYCARFRTEADGGPLLEATLSDAEERRAELAQRYAACVVGGSATDELTADMQDLFSEAEFADLVFSIGWFIGMQHVGRLMHWDDSCPVAPIRKLVEAGEAE